jgi:hypothetical protein
MVSKMITLFKTPLLFLAVVSSGARLMCMALANHMCRAACLCYLRLPAWGVAFQQNVLGHGGPHSPAQLLSMFLVFQQPANKKSS